MWGLCGLKGSGVGFKYGLGVRDSGREVVGFDYRLVEDASDSTAPLRD